MSAHKPRSYVCPLRKQPTKFKNIPDSISILPAKSGITW